MRRKVREKGKNKEEEGEMLSPPTLPLRYFCQSHLFASSPQSDWTPGTGYTCLVYLDVFSGVFHSIITRIVGQHKMSSPFASFGSFLHSLLKLCDIWSHFFKKYMECNWCHFSSIQDASSGCIAKEPEAGVIRRQHITAAALVHVW